MLSAMLAACAALIFVLVLAVPHAAKTHRLAHLFRAQQKWAEMMDATRNPIGNTPWRARGAARAMGTTNLSSQPPRAPSGTMLYRDRPGFSRRLPSLCRLAKRTA
jgi:hypothetical protein